MTNWRYWAVRAVIAVGAILGFLFGARLRQ
jgi:hypothetical protein